MNLAKIKAHLKNPYLWVIVLMLVGCILAYVKNDWSYVYVLVIVMGILLAVVFVIRGIRNRGDW